MANKRHPQQQSFWSKPLGDPSGPCLAVARGRGAPTPNRPWRGTGDAPGPGGRARTGARPRAAEAARPRRAGPGTLAQARPPGGGGPGARRPGCPRSPRRGPATTRAPLSPLPGRSARAPPCARPSGVPGPRPAPTHCAVTAAATAAAAGPGDAGGQGREREGEDERARASCGGGGRGDN